MPKLFCAEGSGESGEAGCFQGKGSMKGYGVSIDMYIEPRILYFLRKLLETTIYNRVRRFFFSPFMGYNYGSLNLLNTLPAEFRTVLQI